MAFYDIETDPELDKTLSKLVKKDRHTFERVGKKIVQIAENPHLGKSMRNVLKKRWRIHVGSFVLL